MSKETKFKESTIRKVLTGMSIDDTHITKSVIDEFINLMNKEAEIEKLEAKRIKEEEDSKLCVEIVIDKLPDGKTVQEWYKEYINENYYGDAFYRSEGLPDEGDDLEEYIMIGDKLYLGDIHCEAEWVGDWSVRKNLPGEISVTKITEIKNFEVIEVKEGYVIAKLK